MPDSTIESPLKTWVRALEATAPIALEPQVTLPTRVEELADRYGDAPALIGEHAQLTYRELAARSNQYARWSISQGMARGDVVCLAMLNCPEYFAIWLGISRTGVIVSLLNTNLTGESLIHAIQIAAPKCVIAGADLVAEVAEVRSKIGSDVRWWAHGTDQRDFQRIERAIERVPTDPVTAAECALPSIRDRALYIYTSGTTGLPKAANVSHHRVMQWSYWFAGLLDTQPSDRMYNCLPMYHSIGGVAAIGSTLVHGGTVIVRRRFSARAFWDDIVDEGCTLFQYIGELCRFLLNSPVHPRERDHRLRICCGNGLRADVWKPFQERFGIPRILEFYAATEANFSLYNCEGVVGAIGRVPPFLAHRFPIALVKFDVDAGAPVRGDDGFCQRCAPDEVGEAISRIAADGASSDGQFDGYTDRSASERKVLRDVFKAGDSWFRSGDLMRRDASGFYHFVDRVGDTFRWKGENVSTTEVEEAVAACPGVSDAIVYGVTVPGMDGRAGMAALVTDDAFDIAALQRFVGRLPEYARPVFIRTLVAIETTGTFKPKKQDLVREGYDPGVVADPLFWYDRVDEAFRPLDASGYDRIRAGNVRL